MGSTAQYAQLVRFLDVGDAVSLLTWLFCGILWRVLLIFGIGVFLSGYVFLFFC